MSEENPNEYTVMVNGKKVGTTTGITASAGNITWARPTIDPGNTYVNVPPISTNMPASTFISPSFNTMKPTYMAKDLRVDDMLIEFEKMKKRLQNMEEYMLILESKLNECGIKLPGGNK